MFGGVRQIVHLVRVRLAVIKLFGRFGLGEELGDARRGAVICRRTNVSTNWISSMSTSQQTTSAHVQCATERGSFFHALELAYSGNIPPS